jgi:hypothetical protein
MCAAQCCVHERLANNQHDYARHFKPRPLEPMHCRKVELLGEKNPVTLVARPASAAQQIITAADKLHDATRFRAEQLFVQVITVPPCL